MVVREDTVVGRINDGSEKEDGEIPESKNYS